MWKLVGLLVLVCGAASAGAEATRIWCSEGAQLLPSKQDDGWILKVDGKPDETLTNLRDIHGADLIIYADGAEQRQNDLLYMRDRIFRPCDMKSTGEKESEREAELKATIEKLSAETSKLETAIQKILAEASKPKQTLSGIRRAISQIVQELK